MNNLEIMGGGTSRAAEGILLTIDKDPKSTTEKFTRLAFNNNTEFEVLKLFCAKHQLTQSDLVKVFKKYCSSEEAYFRQFHIATLDVKKKFLDQTKLLKVSPPLFYFYLWMHLL